MKKTPSLHPFLFAFFSIIFLYTNNISEMSAADIPAPALVVMALTFLIWLILTKILHDPARAGIITTLLLITFFFYGHIYDAIRYTYIGDTKVGRHRFLLPIYFIIFVFFLFRGLKTKHVSNLTVFFNISTISLIAMSVISFAAYQLNGRSISIQNAELESRASILKLKDNTETYPDIYYIISDGYGNAITLAKFYGFDNSEFLDQLKEKGFYIADKSASNYADTRPSLASSLNMEYINDLAAAVVKGELKEGVFSDITRRSNVTEFLKSIGYKFVLIRSGSGPTDRNRYADIMISCTAMNEFIRVLIHTSLLSVIEKYFYLPDQHRKMLKTAFDRLKEIPDIDGPKFVLCHVLSTHPPFVFDADGGAVNPDDMSIGSNIWLPREAYIGQLSYTNKLIIGAVNEILEKSDRPPIIIIQGDHGPASLNEWENPSNDFIFERMMILNAYHIPEGDSSQLYPTISPVNSFRVVFNRCFNTEMDVFEDRSFMPRVIESNNLLKQVTPVSYELNEVTNVIRGFLEDKTVQDSLLTTSNN
ncbi:LTA synthase family protein [bacterium]|nr:LTA synthase family protein [bacterium]